MILPFVTKDNEILTTPTTAVSEVTPEIKKLANDMLTTMRKYKGIGLAANQVNHSHRMAVVECPKYHKGPIVLINPEIVAFSEGKEEMVEGCLSLPKEAYKVSRSTNIIVNYINKNGKVTSLKAKGFLARIIQHEVDHLNGLRICDLNHEDSNENSK